MKDVRCGSCGGGRHVSAATRVVAEDGVTSIEYALLAALVATLIIGGLTLVGVNLAPLFRPVIAAI